MHTRLDTEEVGQYFECFFVMNKMLDIEEVDQYFERFFVIKCDLK